MKTYRCKYCKRKFKITRSEVNTRKVIPYNKDNNRGYQIVCPFCYLGNDILFKNLPKRVKSIISKEWLN